MIFYTKTDLVRASLLCCILLANLCPTLTNANEPSANQQNNFRQFEGKIVNSITLKHPLNLSKKDILAKTNLSEGQVFSAKALEEAVSKIRSKDIFSEIATDIDENQEAVDIVFQLTAWPVIYEVIFLGNAAFDKTELARIARGRSGAKLTPTILEEIEHLIRGAYVAKGFYNVEVSIDVEPHAPSPFVRLVTTINEGYQSRIWDVVFDGKFPEDVQHVKQAFLEHARGATADGDSIRSLRTILLAGLRNEGYLQSSVNIEKSEFEPLSGDLELLAHVQTGTPLSIVFLGNSKLNARQLLSPLQLESRTVPFSGQAVSKLVSAIRNLYQQSGYYFTEVSYQSLPERNGRQIYQINIEEGERIHIGNIRFEGTSAISSSELLKLMETKIAWSPPFRRWRPGYAVDSVLVSDMTNIEQGMKRLGFLDAKASFNIDRNENNFLNINIKIDEGQQAKIGDVAIHWEQIDIGNAESLGLLSLPSLLKKGDYVNVEALENERVRIQEFVSSKGFPNAKVILDTERTSGQATFRVKTGPHIRFGEIEVRGNVFTHDDVIIKNMTLRKGESWNKHAISSSTQNLYGKGAFRSVNIEALKPPLDANSEDIVVSVRERDTGSMEFGIALNTEDGLHLKSELTQRNFQGHGTSLSARLDGFFRSGERVLDAGRGRVVYSHPQFLDTNITLVTETFIQSDIELTEVFDFDRFGIATAVHYPLLETLRSSFTYSLFRERLSDVADDIVIGQLDRGSHLLSNVSAELILDLRDDTFNPRQGYLSSLKALLSTEAIGSEASFYTISSNHSVFLPLTSRLVWANNARVLYSRPFSDTKVVPLSFRHFLGGRTTLRGFSRNEIGPRSSLGNIAGGDVAVSFNTELQIDMSENFIGVVFLDAGQAFLERQGDFQGKSNNFEDLRFSPGIGLRYRTPIGPLSFEYGFATDREFGERFGRLYAGIGGAF